MTCPIECGKDILESSKYCIDHTCIIKNCFRYSADRKTCFKYTCLSYACLNIVMDKDANVVPSPPIITSPFYKFCVEHKCHYINCPEQIDIMKRDCDYCFRHHCQNYCLTMVSDDQDYCLLHLCKSCDDRTCDGDGESYEYCERHVCGCLREIPTPDLIDNHQVPYFCIEHHCICDGDNALDYLTFGAEGCRVHNCTTCENKRVPEHWGYYEGYCQQCLDTQQDNNSDDISD